MSYFGIPIRNGLPIGLGSVAPLGINTFSPFSPASLFANGEQGWWYDPSNFATLFQDSAGTTPVTAVEQPVGLQLDLSKGLVLGSEICPNGTFDTATGWILTAGATISGGKLNFSAAAPSNPNAYITLTGAASGDVYSITFTISDYVSGAVGVRLYSSGIASPNYSANGTYTVVLAIPVSNGNFGFVTSGASTTLSIDNVSVKKVTGNHRFQSTSANRPVVSARVNLLTKTEDLTNAAWSKQGTTAPSVSVLLETATTGLHGVLQNNLATYAVGTNYTLVAKLKANGRNYALLYSNQGSVGRYFDITPGTAGAVLGNYGTAIAGNITALGNDEFLCEITIPSAGSLTSAEVYASDTGSRVSYTGDVTKGLYLYYADFRVTNIGVNLPVYQRVNTSTDYDSTGFPIYIKPNGSNQFMQTNSINFTATDKMTVWQGVRKLSDAATASIYQLSADETANNGTFVAYAPITTAEYSVRSRGTAASSSAQRANADSIQYAAPVTNVLCALHDISASSTLLRLNGTQVASATAAQGSGNFGNYPAYFYATGGTSTFFNGNDYGSIARGAASTAAQITDGETYINSLTKAF
jgi:hypothetical protein